MTLEEQKFAICKLLPDTIGFFPYRNSIPFDGIYYWRQHESHINWETEGLQVCHEAEKNLKGQQWVNYTETLGMIIRRDKTDATWHATYQQRLEALCRTLFPDRFPPR